MKKLIALTVAASIMIPTGAAVAAPIFENLTFSEQMEMIRQGAVEWDGSHWVYKTLPQFIGFSNSFGPRNKYHRRDQ